MQVRSLVSVILVLGAAAPALAGGGRWSAEEYSKQPPAQVVYATGATSSSQGSKSFATENATGQPDVFPKFDVAARIWSPKTTAKETEWLELSFPETTTSQIRIFETTSPGCVSEVRCAVTSAVFLRMKVVKTLHRFDGARVLYVNVDPPRKLSKIRITFRPKDAGFSRPGIDAVGLVVGSGSSQPAPSPEPAGDLTCTSGRYDTEAYGKQKLDFKESYVWAKTAKASSSMGGKSVGPEGACGKPQVFPKHGAGRGMAKAARFWAPKDMGSELDWIEFSFAPTKAKTLHLFENIAPGCVVKVAINGQVVFSQKPKKDFYKSFNQKAQVLWFELSREVEVTSIKVWVSPQGSGSVRPGIDAFGLRR
tara:strand:- start:94 stop:1188 length:1095 start_codon:yes stop_codon:yes gene_type:complete